MQRLKAILTSNDKHYTYLVDRYVSGENISKIKKKFIMLRKYDFSDNMAFDSDIFIIDKDIWNKYKENNWELVFPNTYNDTNKNLTATYYNDISFFDENFKYNENDLYHIVNSKDDDFAPISCDIIRIYHPNNKKNQKYIVHIDSFINSIHFHLYCSTANNLKVNSETEIQVDNLYYSEYFDILIPNIEELFINTFYIENLNNIENYDTNIIPMSIFKKKFTINLENGIFSKTYLNTKSDDSSNFINQINVTLFPYSNIDETTGIYLNDNELNSNTVTFYNTVNFALKSKFILDEKPKIISTFTLPEGSLFNNFSEAYMHYNDVNIEDYSVVYIETEDDDEYIAEEYGDQDGKEMNLLGYKIEIAIDNKFKNIIYENTIWDKSFDDFSFELNGIFSKWEQYPDVLICRTKFIDRYLGNIIVSNNVLITKDNFKYMINDIPNKNRIMMKR